MSSRPTQNKSSNHSQYSYGKTGTKARSSRSKIGRNGLSFKTRGSFNAAVRKVVESQRELKELSNTLTEASLSTIGTPIFVDLPLGSISDTPISTGRIGNEIQLKRIQGRFIFYSGNSNPIGVRCTVMKVDVSNFASNATLEAVLYDPIGSVGQDITFSGTTLDLLANFNKEYFTVISDEMFVLGTTTTYESSKVFTFDNHINKKILFADTDTVNPTNFRYACVVCARHMNNDAVDSLVEMTYNVRSFFTDA